MLKQVRNAVFEVERKVSTEVYNRPMLKETEALLVDYFRDDIYELENMVLGEKTGWLS